MTTRRVLAIGVGMALGLGCRPTGVPLAAQSTAADTRLDSAATARDAWQRANRASTAREALPYLQRAAMAWPAQPAYWSALGRIAARAGDSASLRMTIDGMTARGFEPAIINDSALWAATQAMLPVDRWAEIERRARPIVGSQVLVELPDSTVFAEGVDVSARTGALYVASVRRRTILEIRDGQSRDLDVSRDPRIGAVFGVRVAPDGATLWCTTAPHENAVGGVSAAVQPALVEIRIRDGAIRRVVPLPGADSGHSRLPGDLVILPDGTVLVSDSDHPSLLRFAPATGTWTAYRDARWRSPQGIAVVPGGKAVIVADWSLGLFHVDLATQRVSWLPAPTTGPVVGLDGLVWYGDGVIGVQNGITPARIVHVALSPSADAVQTVRVLDRQPALAPDPTIGTLQGDRYVYVATSQWAHYRDGQRTQLPLPPLRLLCIPLSPVTERHGMRTTASAPPVGASCKVNDARSP